MKVNIGKNTLGGGKKMQVGLREYSRSSHDLSYIWRSTMGIGMLVPFMKTLALPGDTFEIDTRRQTLTKPTNGPLFGSFKQQNDVFFCPIRLYNALLHNNSLNIGMDMSKVLLPIIDTNCTSTKLSDYLEGSNNYIRKVTHPSSLLCYLGLRNQATDGTTAITTRKQNAIPLLAYFDIFKNYYANKQEQYFYTIGYNNDYYEYKNGTNSWGIYAFCGDTTWVQIINNRIPRIGEELEPLGTISAVVLGIEEAMASGLNKPWTVQFEDANGIKKTFETEATRSGQLTYAGGTYDYWFIDEKEQGQYAKLERLYEGNYYSYRKWDLEYIDDMRDNILSSGSNQWSITNATTPAWKQFLNQFAQKDTNNYLNSSLPLFGLALKTYQSDIFTNWINSDWIDGDNGINAITAIDTSSGEFTLDTLNLSKKVYDMLNRIAVSDGSYNAWITTVYTAGGVPHYETPVYIGGWSNEIEFQQVISNSATENEPLGTLAGRGITTQHKGGKIHYTVDEPGYIIGICSLTPRVDYCQGNDWDMSLRTLNDIHKPQLDGIGFQDLLFGQMCSMGTPAQFNTSIGKQPSWINYMTNFNKTYGDFAILNNCGWMVLNRYFTTPEEYTTYIQPDLYNYIFADTSIDSQNFWVQIAVDMKVRRVMSAKQIPTF